MMKLNRIVLIFFLGLGLSLVLVGCGNRNVKNSPGTGGTQASSPAGGSSPAATGTKRGGYYLDDGPGDNPPADIDSIPDAVPRPEALYARASRPYSALGQRYTPMAAYAPYKQRGIASWYGKRYHGQKTSAGEIYDMYGMSGAHTILPLPSYARVTNPENGRSVIVRINDRGPFHSDRLIDLSYAAAYKLRIIGKGSSLVEVEAIDTRPGAKPAVATPMPTTAIQTSPVSSQASTQPVVMPPNESNVHPASVTSDAPANAPGMYVQVGAFKNQDNAELLSNKLRAQKLVENSPVNSWYNDGIYRVRIGPYSSRADAESTAARIKQALKVNTYIIVSP